MGRYDDEILGWYSRFHPRALSAEEPKPSEERRANGARLKRDFGLYRCGNLGRKWNRTRFLKRGSASCARSCDWFVVARRGQLTASCRLCGRRIHLGDREPVAQHDDPDFLRYLITCVRGWRKHHSGMPTWLFERYEIRHCLDQIHAHDQAADPGAWDNPPGPLRTGPAGEPAARLAQAGAGPPAR